MMLEKPSREPFASEYCIAPWFHGFVHADGTIRPCCTSTEVLGDTKRGDTIDSVWNGEGYQKLRADLLNKKIPESCNGCIRSERVGSVPTRKRIKKHLLDVCNLGHEDISAKLGTVGDKRLRTLDVSFGRVCNLKCRFCGPHFSTQWDGDVKKLLEKDRKFWVKWGIHKPINSKKDTDETIVLSRDCDTSGLKYIEVKGGEPFLNMEFSEFLKRFVDSGEARGIRLHLSSNLTVVDTSVLELFREFRRVSINVSMEGTGDLYKYLRGGRYSLEDHVTPNLLVLDQFPNIEINFHMVLSALNVFGLKDFVSWYDDLAIKNKNKWTFRNLAWPDVMTIYKLPIRLREKALQKIDHIDSPQINKIKQLLVASSEEPTNDDLECLIQYVGDLDEIRGTSILDVVPEFSEVLKSRFPEATV